MDCFEIMMQHTITVNGPQVAGTDSGGGVLETWPTMRAEGILCLLNAPTDTNQQRFSADNPIGNVTIATFYSGIQANDQIIVTGGPNYVGAVMRVLGLKDQPGVDFMGFPSNSPMQHFVCEHIRRAA